jgi:5-formyltetrahydrofolate cyclo-ligase
MRFSEIPPAPDKKEMRARMLSSLRTHFSERRERSRHLCAAVQSLAEWSGAHTVALFASLPTEPDVKALLTSALASGKRVALPRIVGRDLEWIQIEGEQDCGSSPAFAQLQEPTGTQRIERSELSVILVPGLAFGREGERLGRGGGFYDRALALLGPSVHRIGVCYRFQVCTDVPQEPHDERVHRVITD